MGFMSAKIDVSSSGDNTIVSAVAGKMIKVVAFSLQANPVVGTVSVKWKDGTNTDLTGAYIWGAREGMAMSMTPQAFLFATSAGNALILNLSNSSPVVGHVTYFDTDAV